MIHYILQMAKDELHSILASINENKYFIFPATFVAGCIIYFMQLVPSSNLLIATAGEASGYSELVRLSHKELQNNGIDVQSRFTSGSIENITLLGDPNSDVGAALVQGGLDPSDAQLSEIVSLGSVGYEPVWIFYRKDIRKKPNKITDFSNLQVGVGPNQGGTIALVRKVFLAHGIEMDGKSNFVIDSYENNLRNLKAGSLEAAIIVAPILSPAIIELLQSSEYGLFEFEHADAYEKRFAFLKAVKIPTGSIDMGAVIPKHDVTLVATTTSLLVKKSMHPDMQILLLATLKKIFLESKNLFFVARGEMPSYSDPTYPLSESAKYFYENGLTFGLKYFPFKLAGVVDKLWLILTAVFVIAYPLSRLNIGHRIMRYHAAQHDLYRRLFEIQSALIRIESLSSEQLRELHKCIVEIHSSMAKQAIPIGAELEMAVKASFAASLQYRIEERLRQLRIRPSV